uniref:PKD/REJ-like domain-containing protein n=1 Tax=Glossina palpalis gambiensis TaxID=67801 RepID=A0A1B0BJ31_9MUSC
MKSSETVLRVLLLFRLISSDVTLDLPSFRIIAPQNLCKSNGNESQSQQPDGVTIAFQPKDGIKLIYQFQIFFTILEPNTFNQRETLLVWKAVRALEELLNGKERSKISQENLALIRKSNVMAGVSYVFHVEGITEGGETTPEQVFDIEYRDGVLQNVNVPEGINFLFVGTEEIVANMEYRLIAKVSFCLPKYDYYFEWIIEDLQEEYKELENTISSCLQIPKNVLKAGKRNIIEARVMENKTKRLLAKDAIEIKVLTKGYQVMIIPSTARVGEGSNITLRLFIKNYDEVKEISILWKCVGEATKQELKSSMPDNKEQYFEVAFNKVGSYEVWAFISINDVVSKVKADIEVISSIFVSYDFQHTPNLYTSANEGFQFTVTVLNLVPLCEAIWLSAQEDGFEFIKPGVLDKEQYGYTKISNLEKYYLEEIADFTNSTVNRDITLTIPAKTDLWHGFEGDSLYKFRLDVTCPKPYKDNSNSMVTSREKEEEPWKKFLTSYFSFDLHTNSPPQVLKLQMEPLKGKAMKTAFSFISASAKDLLLDSPLSYEFFIKADDYEIHFEKYFEYKTWNTKLPYTLKQSIEYFVEICDVRLACSVIRNTTEISLEYEEFSNKQLQEYLTEIQTIFGRTDFSEGFNTILMISMTFKNGQSKHLEKWKMFVRQFLAQEIDKFLERPQEGIYIPDNDVLQFVSKCKENLKYLKINNKILLQKLLEILEQIVERNGLSLNERFKRRIRTKRIVNNQQQQKLLIETHLSLLEDLLETSDLTVESQMEYATSILRLTQQMCLMPLKGHENVKRSNVHLIVKKLKGHALIYNTQVFENAQESILLNFKVKNADLVNQEKLYCLAIIFLKFPENMGSLQLPLINYNVYEFNDNWSAVKPVECRQKIENFQLHIASATDNNFNKCAMTTSVDSAFNLNAWSFDDCKAKPYKNYLLCICNEMGFLKMDSLYLTTTAATTRPKTTAAITLNIPTATAAEIESRETSLPTLTSSRESVTLSTLATLPSTFLSTAARDISNMAKPFHTSTKQPLVNTLVIRIDKLKKTVAAYETDIKEKARHIDEKERELAKTQNALDEQREARKKSDDVVTVLESQLQAKNEEIRNYEMELSETEELRKTIMSLMESKRPKRKA